MSLLAQSVTDVLSAVCDYMQSPVAWPARVVARSICGGYWLTIWNHLLPHSVPKVDHVEGELREGFDALDAFLCHTWAVTVTGAPKVRLSPRLRPPNAPCERLLSRVDLHASIPSRACTLCSELMGELLGIVPRAM